MKSMQLHEHLTNYRRQRDELQRQLIAITGAIHALERLQEQQSEQEEAQADGETDR